MVGDTDTATQKQQMSIWLGDGSRGRQQAEKSNYDSTFAAFCKAS